MMSYFSGIFGASPIKPLQRHMKTVLECTRELVPLFQAANRDDFDMMATAQARVSQLEREADTLKKELRLSLPVTLFLPMNRRDLLELLRVQDQVANKAKDIAGLALGRQMRIPSTMQEAFEKYLNRCLDAVEMALTAVNEMDELVVTGFRGAQADVVHDILRKLDSIENDTDRMQVALRSTLRTLEREMSPVDVMFLYKIIDWTGDLADHAQRVGSRLQLMLAS
jgi:predicted phosphate transport protein (TIGR00153 family)